MRASFKQGQGGSYVDKNAKREKNEKGRAQTYSKEGTMGLSLEETAKVGTRRTERPMNN